MLRRRSVVGFAGISLAAIELRCTDYESADANGSVIDFDIASGVANAYWVKVGGVEPIAEEVNRPLGLAVDEHAVYWSQLGDGLIKKRAKP